MFKQLCSLCSRSRSLLFATKHYLCTLPTSSSTIEKHYQKIKRKNKKQSFNIPALTHFFFLFYSFLPFFCELFTGSFSESKEGSATFPEISTDILEKIIQYFHYKQRWTNSREPVPEFQVAPEEALNLLMAANFLDC